MMTLLRKANANEKQFFPLFCKFVWDLRWCGESFAYCARANIKRRLISRCWWWHMQKKGKKVVVMCQKGSLTNLANLAQHTLRLFKICFRTTYTFTKIFLDIRNFWLPVRTYLRTLYRKVRVSSNNCHITSKISYFSLILRYNLHVSRKRKSQLQN